MKNLLLVIVLLGFLFIQVIIISAEYKEYAEKWYFDLDSKFDKEGKKFVIEQVDLINQCFLVLQETILNTINEEHYEEDELKMSTTIINSLKKEKEKPLFKKLTSFYKVYDIYKKFNRTKEIFPCILNVFKFICQQQSKNQEEIEQIIRNLIFVFSLRTKASDEKIRSLLSILKPTQEVFSEILRLDRLQQQESYCVIL